tara:strand:+ start:687 stop:875 length:189 start_codon:yes stop_codon:yes gene_type:complete
MKKYLWRLFNYLITRAEHRRIIKELNQLTDAELRDMGINRCDIDRLVWLDEDKEKRGKKNND